MPRIGPLELPYIPQGFTPEQLLAAALAYGSSRSYVPHMIMREGEIEVRDGVPGVWIKYYDRDGLTTTEWTPLNVPTPRQAPAGPATPAPSSGALPTPPARVADAQNPRAVAYAQRRLAQLRNLGISFEDAGDSTATWRKASQTISALASRYGFADPRAFLRLGSKPRNTLLTPEDYSTNDALPASRGAPPASRGALPASRGALPARRVAPVPPSIRQPGDALAGALTASRRPGRSSRKAFLPF